MPLYSLLAAPYILQFITVNIVNTKAGFLEMSVSRLADCCRALVDLLQNSDTWRCYMLQSLLAFHSSIWVTGSFVGIHAGHCTLTRQLHKQRSLPGSSLPAGLGIRV